MERQNRRTQRQTAHKRASEGLASLSKRAANTVKEVVGERDGERPGQVESIGAPLYARPNARPQAAATVMRRQPIPFRPVFCTGRGCGCALPASSTVRARSS